MLDYLQNKHFSDENANVESFFYLNLLLVDNSGFKYFLKSF